MTKRNDFNVDELLKNLYREPGKEDVSKWESLRDLFEIRIEELKITATDASKILNIQYRALNGVLDGTQKTVDYIYFPKIANFLNISVEKVFSLYINELKKNFEVEPKIDPEKVKFIKENFDLALLKKAKVINSLTDYEEIENKISKLLGLNDIRDYEKPSSDVAFSAGVIKPKNELNRSIWISRAKIYFEKIANPNEYNRESLIKYFPEIRWHSTNVNNGLIDVIKSLYKLGVTVIYQAPLPSLHLKGATFIVNEKPCIVLTNYRGFYPTLWFSLIHELYHVLFDLDEIRKNKYHLSDDDNKQLTVEEKEREANEFAREYLFSISKTSDIRSVIGDTEFIVNFARENHVHPSFIYVFNAFDLRNSGKAWAIAKSKQPDFENLLKPLNNPWIEPVIIDEHIKTIKKIYN